MLEVSKCLSQLMAEFGTYGVIAVSPKECVHAFGNVSPCAVRIVCQCVLIVKGPLRVGLEQSTRHFAAPRGARLRRAR